MALKEGILGTDTNIHNPNYPLCGTGWTMNKKNMKNLNNILDRIIKKNSNGPPTNQMRGSLHRDRPSRQMNNQQQEQTQHAGKNYKKPLMTQTNIE